MLTKPANQAKMAAWAATVERIVSEPPGSDEGAGAAQGLWRPGPPGRGQYAVDRGLGVGPPGGMDGHRPGARPGRAALLSGGGRPVITTAGKWCDHEAAA